MKILIFGKENCAKCQTTRNKINFFIKKWRLIDKVEIVFWDMDTVDGNAEGAFYDIWEIPGVIIEKNGRVINRWIGEVINSEKLKEGLNYGNK